MTKGQVLILLLIIALLFYYLTQEDKPQQLIKPNFKKPWPKTIKNTKPTYPLKPQVEVPSEPPVKLPSDFPIIECLSAQAEPIKPYNFHLNPPHSELNSQDEPKETLNCPSAKVEFIPDTTQVTESTINFLGSEWVTEPASELSSEEQRQRKTQELSDYNWLLNNKTITDWYQEHQLTNNQFQVLRSLVSEEEMNTLNYFLNLLPTDYEWLLISEEFKNPALIESWQNHNFTYQQTQDWLKIGLAPTDYALVAWLRDVKKLTPEETLNFKEFTKLKAEFNHAN